MNSCKMKASVNVCDQTRDLVQNFHQKIFIFCIENMVHVHLFSHFSIQFIAKYFMKVPASDIAKFFFHGHTSFFFSLLQPFIQNETNSANGSCLRTQVVHFQRKTKALDNNFNCANRRDSSGQSYRT